MIFKSSLATEGNNNPMDATKQKLEWAHRAVRELRSAEKHASHEDFQYNFGAFLALLGALRQFIMVDPHKSWVSGMDEKHIAYCSCIDLRNVDVHVDNALQKPRSHFKISLSERSVQMSDSVSVTVTRAGDHADDSAAPADIAPPVKNASQEIGESSSSVTVSYFVNPDTLPGTFAVLKYNKSARPTKTDEQVYLRETPAADAAEAALNFFESIVLPAAQDRGIPIP